MKIDQELVQQILKVMEDRSNHQVSNFEIMARTDSGMDVNTQDRTSSKVSNEQKLDNFIGHIRYLYDQGFIDCNNPNLGIAEHNQGCSLFEIEYRLTPDAHAYLDNHKEVGVTFRFKNWMISFLNKVWTHIENYLAYAMALFIVGALYMSWEWFSK